MIYLKRNLPLFERLARLTGAGLMAFAAWQGGLAMSWTWTWALGLTALGLALTALLGFCPACAMMGRRPLDRQA